MMISSNYPNCKVKYSHWIGDGLCDRKYNTKEACGWDGGDCLDFNSKYPNCNVAYPEDVGDGNCQNYLNEYNTEDCGWDGGDCILYNNIKEKIREKYPDCYRVDDYTKIGDCICDQEYNTKACGWDGKDCGRPGRLSDGAITGIIISALFVFVFANIYFIRNEDMYRRRCRRRERIDTQSHRRNQIHAGIQRYQQGMNALEQQGGAMVSPSNTSIVIEEPRQDMQQDHIQENLQRINDLVEDQRRTAALPFATVMNEEQRREQRRELRRGQREQRRVLRREQRRIHDLEEQQRTMVLPSSSVMNEEQRREQRRMDDLLEGQQRTTVLPSAPVVEEEPTMDRHTLVLTSIIHKKVISYTKSNNNDEQEVNILPHEAILSERSICNSTRMYFQEEEEGESKHNKGQDESRDI